MLKQTSVYSVSLHFHTKFRNCLLKFDAVCTVSAFSLSNVSTRSLLCYDRLLSTRSPNVAVVSGCRFWPNFRLYFEFYAHFLLSSGFTFGDNCAPSDTSCPVPLWVSIMVALLVSWMRGSLDTVFSVVACCIVAHFFLLVSCISVRGPGRESVCLCTSSFV